MANYTVITVAIKSTKTSINFLVSKCIHFEIELQLTLNVNKSESSYEFLRLGNTIKGPFITFNK